MVSPTVGQGEALLSRYARRIHRDVAASSRQQPHRLAAPGWGLAIAVWIIYTVGMAGAWMATDNAYEQSVGVNKDMWWVTLVLK